MKKVVFIILASCALVKASAQTGIGTTAPVNKFEVVTPTANASNSGSAANGHFRLGASVGSQSLDFGLSSSSTYAWLQSRSKSNYANNYNLILNPNGGGVGVGTIDAYSTLTIGSANGSIPGEISLNPAYTSNEGGQINIKKSLNGSTADWIIDQYGTTSSDARFRIFNSIAESNGLSILENGNIGMGLTNPTVRLQVSGDIIANSIAGSSDIRFKKNIRPIYNALDKVKALKGVYFNWDQKNFPDKSFGAQDELGFIAQEVEKVVPEIVTKDKTKEEYRSVKYDKLVALLVEAIKEQQKQIDSLKIAVKKKNNKR
jgi:hypothetical protein